MIEVLDPHADRIGSIDKATVDLACNYIEIDLIVFPRSITRRNPCAEVGGELTISNKRVAVKDDPGWTEAIVKVIGKAGRRGTLGLFFRYSFGSFLGSFLCRGFH